MPLTALTATSALTAPSAMSDYHGAAAYALGLALTLALAYCLTPARWWRRPTARGIVILGGGTWALGALLLQLFAIAPPAGATMQADAAAQQPPSVLPAADQRYRVHRDLNVRVAAGVGAARMALVPAGAFVTPTGPHDGDWWQIRYDSDAGTGIGWASSLWLRRAAER